MGERATVAHSGEKTRSANFLRFPRPPHARINFADETSHQAGARRHGRFEAVPSRGRGARPTADQASQEGLRQAQFSVSPDPIKTLS